MSARDLSTTAPTSAALVADTAFNPTLVSVGLTRERANACWTTSDGYTVYRTGPYRYWVADREGRWALQSTLAQARADIEWLRERGR